MVSIEDNKAVVRSFVDHVWNHADLTAADELVDTDYVVEGVGTGPSAVRNNVMAFRAAFPDLSIAIEELIAEGDKVVARMRLSGTLTGPFRGHPATGRAAVWREVGIWTVRAGRLVESWFLADSLGLRRQLGGQPQDTSPSSNMPPTR